MRLRNFFIISFVSLTILTIVSPVSAQTGYDLLAPVPGYLNEGTDRTTAGEYIPGLVRLVIAFSGVMAIIMIIWGGIQYMSTDAVSGKSGAKTTIENAIWGFVLVISAWLILNTVNPELVKFDLSIQQVNTSGDIGGNLGGSGRIEGCERCGRIQAGQFLIAGQAPDVCRLETGSECLINLNLLVGLRTASGALIREGYSKLEIIEAFPPVSNDARLSDGTCVVVNFSDRPTQDFDGYEDFLRQEAGRAGLIVIGQNPISEGPGNFVVCSQ